MRSSPLSSRNEAIRRALFWAAMLTGAALVGSQFGCDRPQTTSTAAGFPHASRWPLQPTEQAKAGATAELEPVSWWIPLQSAKQPVLQRDLQKPAQPIEQARLNPVPEGAE